MRDGEPPELGEQVVMEPSAMKPSGTIASGPKWSSFSATERRTRLPWPKGKPFRILSIDGGGIKGIFPAAVLAQIEDQLPTGVSVANSFDMIVGTSTGGILALGLGAGRSAHELSDLYITHGGRIFPPLSRIGKVWREVRRVTAPSCDLNALKGMVEGVIGGLRFGDSATRLCIPAFEGRHGEVHIFKTAHHPDYRRDWKTPMTTVALATAAAPTYYPAHDSDGYRYVDGGVWANCPVMVGVVDALACFDIDPAQIRVLSLGCGREPCVVDDKQAKGGMWAWRYALFASMELQTQNALGQAKLLVGPRNVVRLDPHPVTAIGLDDWARARKELPDIASTSFEDAKGRIADHFLDEVAAPVQWYGSAQEGTGT